MVYLKAAMFFVTKNNMPYLLGGSSLLATGGGLPALEHEKIFRDALRYRSRIQVKSIGEFSSKDVLVSVYGVGNPAQVRGSVSSLVADTVSLFEKYNKLSVAGFIPGEIGAEGMAFFAAAVTGLPVVDSDLVGGRAAPEMQMDVFSVFGKSIVPLVGNSNMGQHIVLDGNYTASEVEDLIRFFFADRANMGVVMGYPITAGNYLTIGAKGTISRAMKIGQALAMPAVSIDALLSILGKGTILAKEELKKVNLRNVGGFLQGDLDFKTVRVMVKNENVACIRGNKYIARVPDLIMLIDTGTFEPLHNAGIRKSIGHNVIVMSCKAEEYWYTRRGLSLFRTVLKERFV